MKHRTNATSFQQPAPTRREHTTTAALTSATSRGEAMTEYPESCLIDGIANALSTPPFQDSLGFMLAIAFGETLIHRLLVCKRTSSSSWIHNKDQFCTARRYHCDACVLMMGVHQYTSVQRRVIINRSCMKRDSKRIHSSLREARSSPSSPVECRSSSISLVDLWLLTPRVRARCARYTSLAAMWMYLFELPAVSMRSWTLAQARCSPARVCSPTMGDAKHLT